MRAQRGYTRLHDWLGTCYFLSVRCWMLIMCCESSAEDPKFSIRDWIADARCSRGGDVVHITGACILFYPLTRELILLTADTLPRCPQETIFPDRNKSSTPPRLRRHLVFLIRRILKPRTSLCPRGPGLHQYSNLNFTQLYMRPVYRL